MRGNIYTIINLDAGFHRISQFNEVETVKNLAETDIDRFIEAQDDLHFCGYAQALKKVKNGRKQMIYLARCSTLFIKASVAQLL